MLFRSHRQNSTVYGYPVLGTLPDACRWDNCDFVNGIGSPANFFRKDQIIATTGLSADRFATVIHPSSAVSKSAVIGNGSVLLANTTVCAGATIGCHAMVLPGTTVSHDCRIGDHVCVASGVVLCAGVTAEDLCYLGAGCTVLGGRTVGQGALVGAGSVVVRDVAQGTVVCGNPAAFLRTVQ